MTAVEWLQDKLNNVRPTQICSIETIKEWVEQAKEMEKEQIMDGFINGDKTDCMEHEDIFGYAEQYYNETFNK